MCNTIAQAQRIFTFWSLLIPIGLIAQTPARPPIFGKVTYAYTSDSDAFYRMMDSLAEAKPDQHPQVIPDVKRQFERSLLLEFELYFNADEAIFQVVREAAPSEGEAEWDYRGALLSTNGDQRHYLNITDSVRLYEKVMSNSSSVVHVEQDFASLDWTLSEERKTIGRYDCRKATGSFSFTNHLGNLVTVPVTAWFAPALPYPYGPLGYHGLPGLILELELASGNRRGYRAKEIVIEPGVERELPQLEKRAQLTTEEELNDRAGKQIERIKRGH